MSFAAAIKAFEEKALLKANHNVTQAFISLGTNSVTLTQNINLGGYSNGDIANNWHVSYGAVNVPIPNGPDLSGAASLARINSVAQSMEFYRKDSKIFLTNAMGYSYRANFLGWRAGPGTNGWTWVNNIKAGTGYGFVGIAINNLKGKYM